MNYRLQLLDGKISQALLAAPSKHEMLSYLHEFQQALDDFVGEFCQHEIMAYLCKEAALVQVRLLSGQDKVRPRIVHDHSELSKPLESTFGRLRSKHSQWLYFDRCLKTYDDSSISILKPLQMSQWIRSKALSDADDVIGEFLATQG